MEFSRPSNNASFANPTDRFWSLYLTEAQVQDKLRIARWKGDADGILIFTGLFAATVATFVVSSYPRLSPDSGDQTVALLTDIAVLLANGTQSAASAALLSHRTPSDSGPALADVCVNALWFLSLIVAVFGALLATLVQQWSRQYTQNTQRPGSPSVLGPIHLFISTGVDHFMMEDAIGVIASLVHLAVSLFSVGLLVFLYAVNHVIAWLAIAAVSLGALCYFLLSTLPLIYPDSPYRTPFTIWLRLVMAISSIAYIATYESLTRLAIYWRSLRNEFRTVPLVAPMNGFKGSFKSQMKSKMRSGLSEIKEIARSPGARQIYRAIDTVWQNADEAQEIENFCIAVTPLLSDPPRIENSKRPERNERTLSSLLLMKTDITARVHWLISSTRSLPRTVPQASFNNRLSVGYYLLRDLLKGHLSYSGDTALEPSVTEAFTMLSMELATFTQRSGSINNCYISTYFIARCFAYALPDFRRPKMDNRALESHLEQYHPNTHADELAGCANFHKGSVSGFLPDDAKEKLSFLEDKKIEMTVPKIGRVLDCQHCRLVSMVSFILEFGASASWAEHTLVDFGHVWKPALFNLCHETGIMQPDYDMKRDPNHLSQHLIAHLFTTMEAESWHGLDRIDARSTRPQEFPWKVSYKFNRTLLYFPELIPILRAFVRCFQESQIALLPMEDIYMKLSPLKKETHPSEGTSPGAAAISRPPLLLESGRRWSGIKRTFSMTSRGTRTMTSDPGSAENDDLERVSTGTGSVVTVSSPNEWGYSVSPGGRTRIFDHERQISTKSEPHYPSSFTPKLNNTGDSDAISFPTPVSVIPNGQSYFNENGTGARTWDDQRYHSYSPDATSNIVRSIGTPPPRPETPIPSIPPSIVARHDRLSRFPTSPGLSRFPRENGLHSLPESDETPLRNKRLVPSRTAPPTPTPASLRAVAPVPTPMTRASASDPSNGRYPTIAETAPTAPPATEDVGESAARNGNAPLRDDSEDTEKEGQRMTKAMRLKFMSSPSRAASAENKRAHAAILEAAQSIPTARFLDNEEDYTEEPRQMF